MKLILLHSPLAAPVIWEAVAPDLRARGHRVFVPDLTPILAGSGPYYARLAAYVADLPETAGAYLVAHSGAGALAPAIAARAAIDGVVFVDGLLPHPGRAWFETAPQQLVARMRAMAQDGRVPPWNRFWPERTMATVLPDAAMRERVFACMPELPLAYFDERAPDTVLQVPAAYLLLSLGYHVEAGQAHAAGWPVKHLQSQQIPLQHLAMLTHPRRVAQEIENLAARLRRLSG